MYFFSWCKHLRDADMTELAVKIRRPLTADTDPTDEELALVMREARDLAISRKQISDEWMRIQLAHAVAEAQVRDRLVKQ